MVENFFGALEEHVGEQVRKMRDERTQLLSSAVEAYRAGDEDLGDQLMGEAKALGERAAEASEQLPAVLGAAAVEIKEAFAQAGIELPSREYISKAYRQFSGEPNAIDVGGKEAR